MDGNGDRKKHALRLLTDWHFSVAVGWQMSFASSFLLHIIALFSVFCLTDVASRIFHDSSLLFAPGTSHVIVEESPPVRDREVHIAKEEEGKKPKEKHRHGWNSNQQPQSPELRALYSRPWRPACLANILF